MDKWITGNSPISSFQFAYPYGVPRWGHESVVDTEPFSLETQRSPIVTSGSHGRAGPPPSNDAARGAW